MKTIVVCTVGLLFAMNGYAQDHQGNGLVRATDELAAWIQSEGPNHLNLGRLSSVAYREKMIKTIGEVPVEATKEYLSQNGHGVACIDKTDDFQRKIVCNEQAYSRISNEEQILVQHALFAKVAKISNPVGVSDQLNDFFTENQPGRLTIEVSKRDDFLTKAESETVLRATDSTCGDTWCESADYNYAFKKLDCFKKDKTCTMQIERLRIISFDKKGAITGWEHDIDFTCQVKNVSRYSQVMRISTFDLADRFYDQLNKCISDKEARK